MDHWSGLSKGERKTPIFAIAQFLVNEKNKTELNTEIFHDF